MDAKHIINLKLDGVWYQTPTVYSEAEFEVLMELIGWNVPMNMMIYHFHGNQNKENPVMRKRPTLNFDIESLLRAENPAPATYLDTRTNRPLQLQRQFGRYAIGYSPDTQSRYLIDIEDSRYRHVAQYSAVPITLADAVDFVNKYHRHNVGVKWHKFSLAVEADGEIAGVLIASTPKAPSYDDRTLEINRVCAKPDYHNCCSKLISTAVNIGKAMGYTDFISYTFLDEDGSNFKASGFSFGGSRQTPKAGITHPAPERCRSDTLWDTKNGGYYELKGE